MYFLIFLLGGLAYNVLEYLWRGYSHWSMTIDGGICLLGIFIICTKTNLNFIYKVVAGAVFITIIEFLSGIIFNKILNMGVWDYSQYPYNIMGQICPRYTLLWFALCIPIVTIIDIFGKSYS